MLEALSGKSGQGLPAFGNPPRRQHARHGEDAARRQAGAQPVKVSLAIMIAVMAFGEAGVEREVDDRLFDLAFGQAVLPAEGDMVAELLTSSVSCASFGANSPNIFWAPDGSFLAMRFSPALSYFATVRGPLYSSSVTCSNQPPSAGSPPLSSMARCSM